QATDAHRNGRDQHGQRVDQTQNADALRTGDEAVDHAQNDADDHAEQEEPPVFGAACTAVEYGVFLEDLEIPVHVFIVLLVGCPRCWLPALGGKAGTAPPCCKVRSDSSGSTRPMCSNRQLFSRRRAGAIMSAP